MPSSTRESRSFAAGRWIQLLGIVYATMLAIYLLASPFLAAVAPFRRAPGAEGLGLLLIHLELPEAIESAVRGAGMLRLPRVFGSAYGGVLLVSTGIWIAALLVIQSCRESLAARHVQLTHRWSVIFVVVLVFATPVAVHDFWLSVVWGRVLLDGANPYYAIPPAFPDLPFMIDPGVATYGPLWTLLSGVTVFLSGGSALATAALQKMLIAACWIAVLRVIRALTADRSAATQCTAVVIAGWAPLALFNGIADGHNDPLVILPVLLWLYWLERGKRMSSALALGASIGIKYVTAPLVILNVVRGLLRRRKLDRSELVSAAIPLAVVLIGVAVFWRSPDFFRSVTQMREWRFFTPAAVTHGVAIDMALSATWLVPAVNTVILTVAAGVVFMLLRLDSREAFRAAVLWTMCGIVMATLGHVWPWFILWLLPLAAIQPERRIAWFVVGMAAAAPFIIIPRTIYPYLDETHRFVLPGIGLYASAVATAWLSRGMRSHLR